MESKACFALDKEPYKLKGQEVALQKMQIQLTNEEVLEMGQVFGDIFLKITLPEEVLSRFTPQERLAGLAAEERLAGLDPQVIAAYLKGMEQGPAINRS